MLRQICCLILTMYAAVAGAADLWDDFINPPDRAKPWCYWWWINGHADRETITADLESIKHLGFSGVLMFDSRGYWDDENHVINPKAEIVWGSPPWYDLVEFSIRECARLGLTFTLNASASGGTLNGFLDGKEYETDVMNRDEVIAHLERAVGPILKRVPDLVGTTFTHLYSVSYEGSVKTGGSWKRIKDNFYATMREWAHAHGLKVYSESGGPWAWGSQGVKLDCSQLDMLAHNDFPQGEFWPLKDRCQSPLAGHANQNGRFFQRGIVLTARREKRPIISMEAFTHMLCHYSVDPAFLKPLADIAFADGANRLVWHTFTCSPKKFGVPGAEYFAGSHINRNVTWNPDAKAFVTYLGRCQALLQRGDYVDDGEFLNLSTNYYGWGRYRKDAQAPFTTIHRREGAVDFFFVAGEGRIVVPFNTSARGRTIERWDPVTATRTSTACHTSKDGKTHLELNLPVGGSCFVVFTPNGAPHGAPAEKIRTTEYVLTNSWHVSFAYHDGIAAAPPAPVDMAVLRDWTTCGDTNRADSTALRYFSGTATYRTTVTLDAAWRQGGPCTLSLGALPSGLAHVFVNGKDCGTVWCAPWQADLSAALQEGENELVVRYTNNWYNRLIGDCFLTPEKRITRSTLRYSQVPRTKTDPVRRPWIIRPTTHSGPSISDPLQSSGLLGPVVLKRP